ncbi:unnamed protein product, partial [Thlaspi arvense]
LHVGESETSGFAKSRPSREFQAWIHLEQSLIVVPKKMSNHSREEPSTAPRTDQWYDLVLGPSAKDDSSHKFCTLRCSSEDYKDNDAVLFFDGEKFRLERLHRAVKQLRHLRTPGESAGASQSAAPVEHRLSPVGRVAKSPQVNRSLIPDMHVDVERIEIGKPESSVEPLIPEHAPAISPADDKNDDGEEHHEISMVEIFGSFTPENENAERDNADDGGEYVESLSKQPSIMEEEIADVDDDSGDEGEK